eukprot:g58262.t1
MAAQTTAFDLTCGEAINLLQELKTGFEQVFEAYKGDERLVHEEASKKDVIECYFAACLRIYLIKTFQPQNEGAIRVQDIAQLYSLFQPFMDRMEVVEAVKHLDNTLNKWNGKPYAFAGEVLRTEHMPLPLNLSKDAAAAQDENSKAQASNNNISLNNFKNKLFAKQIARKRAMVDTVKEKLEKLERDRLEAKEKGKAKSGDGPDVEESIRKVLDGTEDEELLTLKRQWEAKRQQKEQLKAMLLQQKKEGGNAPNGAPLMPKMPPRDPTERGSVTRVRATTSVLDAPLHAHPHAGGGHARKQSVTAKTKKKKTLPTAPRGPQSSLQNIDFGEGYGGKVMSPTDSNNATNTHGSPIAKVPTPSSEKEKTAGGTAQDEDGKNKPDMLVDKDSSEVGGAPKPLNNLKAMWEAKSSQVEAGKGCWEAKSGQSDTAKSSPSNAGGSTVTTPLKPARGSLRAAITPTAARSTPGRMTKGWKKKTPSSTKRTPSHRRKRSGNTPKGTKKESKTEQKLDMGQDLEDSGHGEPDSPPNPLNNSIAPPTIHSRMMGPPPTRPPPGRALGKQQQACDNFVPMHPVYFKTKCKGCQQELKLHNQNYPSSASTPPKVEGPSSGASPSKGNKLAPASEKESAGRPLPKQPRPQRTPPAGPKPSEQHNSPSAGQQLKHVKRATVKRGSRKAPSNRKFTASVSRTVDSPVAASSFSPIDQAEETASAATATTPSQSAATTPKSDGKKSASELKKENVKARLAAKKALARTAGEEREERRLIEQAKEKETEKLAEESKKRQAEEDARAELARLMEEERQLQEKQKELEREKLQKEKAEKEKAEQLAKEAAAKEQAAKEKAAKEEQAAKEKAEKLAKEKAEKLAKEKAEQEKKAKEKAAQDQAAKEQAEQLAKEKAKKEQAEKEAAEKKKQQEEETARELARLEEEERQLALLEKKTQEQVSSRIAPDTQESFDRAAEIDEAKRHEAELEAARLELEKAEARRKGLLEEEAQLEKLRLAKLRREKEELDARLAATRRAEELALQRIRKMKKEQAALEKGEYVAPLDSPNSSPTHGPAPSIGPGFRISFQNQQTRQQAAPSSPDGAIVFGEQQARSRRGSYGSDSDSEPEETPEDRSASMGGGLKIHW